MRTSSSSFECEYIHTSDNNKVLESNRLVAKIPLVTRFKYVSHTHYILNSLYGSCQVTWDTHWNEIDYAWFVFTLVRLTLSKCSTLCRSFLPPSFVVYVRDRHIKYSYFLFFFCFLLLSFLVERGSTESFYEDANTRIIISAATECIWKTTWHCQFFFFSINKSYNEVWVKQWYILICMFIYQFDNEHTFSFSTSGQLYRRAIIRQKKRNIIDQNRNSTDDKSITKNDL